jgi:tetratricopeptide (TPR) repeat protein
VEFAFMSNVLNAANVIASVAGAVAANTVTGGVGSAISGAMSLNEILRRLMAKTPQINARIADGLQAELANQHLTPDQKRLIPQMIERAALTPAEVMAAARNPARIAAAMLTKLTDPAHCSAPAQDAFTRVLTPVLTRLLADEAVATTLRPAFEQAVAESLAFIGEQVERMAQELRQTAYDLGVKDTLVLELARRYAPGSDGDFKQACLGLEKALEAAQRLIALGAMPSNLGDQVQAALAEVSRLVSDQQFDAADALLGQKDVLLANEIAERTQARIVMLAARIDIARAQNKPDAAATHILSRLNLDAPVDMFAALRDEWHCWYVSGRDLGVAFDLDLSIHLAHATHARAQTPDQRGAALNDLGVSLQTLGAREADPARLQSAVAASQSALLERTRDRVPLDWAGTQNNLGNALRDLGSRAGDTATLQSAVAAFENALLEYTRDRVPLNWAATQNNLGTALRDLGSRAGDTATLQSAVAALENALLEYTRDRVPLNWAGTQLNLAILELAFHTLSPNPARLTAAREKALVARQVFEDAGADAYMAMADDLLAKIAAA